MFETLSIDTTSISWPLFAVATAFAAMVFAASTLSLQACMAMFGKEIPCYRGTAVLKVRVFAWIGVTVFLGYAFLGSLFFLAAPIAFLLAVGMIAKEAKCDRFMGVLITICHVGISTVAALLCWLVLYVTMPWVGVPQSELDQIVTLNREAEPASGEAFGDVHPVNHTPKAPSTPHANPFVDPAASR